MIAWALAYLTGSKSDRAYLLRMRAYVRALSLCREAHRILPPGSTYAAAIDKASDAVDADLARERQAYFGDDWAEWFDDDLARQIGAGA